MRKLGANQRHILIAAADHPCKGWWPRCGWEWNNPSTTVRAFEGFVARGLAYKKGTKFLLTEAGLTLAAELSAAERSNRCERHQKALVEELPVLYADEALPDYIVSDYEVRNKVESQPDPIPGLVVRKRPCVLRCHQNNEEHEGDDYAL